MPAHLSLSFHCTYYIILVAGWPHAPHFTFWNNQQDRYSMLFNVLPCHSDQFHSIQHISSPPPPPRHILRHQKEKRIKNKMEAERKTTPTKRIRNGRQSERGALALISYTRSSLCMRMKYNHVRNSEHTASTMV